MRQLLTVMLLLALATPATAGPILESAQRRAATVHLQEDPTARQVYRKGNTRKWLEWLGIVGGTVMAFTVTRPADEETCIGRFCDTKWSKSVGGTGLALLTVSAISKVMPDSE